MSNLPKLSPEIIKAYQDEIARSSSPATAKRKMVSLNRFFDWAQNQGHIPENPMAMGSVVQTISNTSPIVVNARKKNKVSASTWAILGLTGGIVVIIFLLLAKLKFPIPFTINFAQESKIQTISTLPSPGASPNSNSANSAVIGAWNLYTKLKLTSETGTPQVGTQTLSFKIYNSPTGGSAIYTSDPQSVTTDSNGSTLISLVGVPTNLFFQNDKLYLEPQIQGQPAPSQRILVPTANVASNLNEYPAANPDTGAAPLTIPVIDANGSLNLAGQSPAVTAKEGNLLVSGQVVTIKTADGSGGNIEINPDANGYAHFLFEGNNSNFLNAQAPNLTSGSLYYGMVPNNATGYDLIKLQSGAPRMTTRFSVDALGNTYTGGNLNVNGNLATDGVNRLTSTGALENITGYSQNSGNFVINQNPGDFASITKKITSGSALSDVLTLTLDERGKPATSNSSYSTLVLNRYDGANEAMALLVKNGNAQFNGNVFLKGQTQLGNFSSLPSAVGTGSIVYNSSDNQVYFWNGTSWVPVGTASSVPFSGITSGTNTSAAMVVGTGASLTYSGSGTINATSLNSLTSSQFLRSDTSTNFTSGTLTTNAGTTLNIAGGLQANGSAGTAGQFLTSGGAGNPPTWDNIASHLTAGTDISITGTTNATIADTSTLNSVTGRGATTSNAVQVGNLTSTGTTTFGGITYTWPGSQTNGYVLSTNGSGTLSWSDPNALIAATQYWNQALGALFPKNNSVDLLVGSSSTSSAKFAFTGVGSGLPTASIAGDIANVATYLTGDGNLGTTNMQGLTFGGSSTGNVVINSRGSTALTANGANLTASGTFTLPNSNTLTGVTNFVQTSGGYSVGGGTTYYFNGSGNLNANAGTFGSTVTLPNTNTLTGVANFTELNNGLSVGGATTYYFDKTGNINANNVTGAVLNATTSVNTGAGAGTGRIDASGNLTNIGTTQLNGITYTWPASQSPNYVLQTNGTGTLSWVDPAFAVAGSIFWTQSNGALYPKNNSVDVLIGSNATNSAKFAFTGVNSGIPTASIAGTVANVSTFIDGNGNISTTNRNNLTLGNSATYNSTGNILLNPNGTGNVGIGVTSPTSKLSVADAAIATGNVINATSAAVTSGNILNIAEGGAQTFSGNAIQLDIQNGGSGNFTGNFLNFLNAGSLKFKVDFSGNIATAGNAAINGGSITTTAATANVFNSAATLNLGTTSTAVNIGAGTGTTTVNNNLSVGGTTTFGGLTYTWPGSQSVNYVLSTNGAGTLSWSDPNALVAATQYWNQALGAVFPKNNSVDLLVGSNSTTSAKFAVTGVNGGLPTATIAGNVANVATYLTGNGNLATTNFQNLTLGGSTTGNIIVNPSNGIAGGNVRPSTTDVTDLGTSSALEFRNVYGKSFFQNGNAVCDITGTNCPSGAGLWAQNSGVLYPTSSSVDVLIGANSTSSAKFAFTGVDGGLPTASVAGNVANVATFLTGDGNLATTNMNHLTLGGISTGQVDVNNNLNLASGNSYLINGTSVLSFNTLGSGVVNSSLTSVGALASGSITTGFGTIATTNTITGTTLNGTTGVNTGAGAGTSRIDASGNLTNIGTTQFNGLTYTWPASQSPNYVLQTNGTGTLSWVDPNSAVASTIYWTQSQGALFPKNNSVDVLIGSNATTSAKFAFTGVNGGLPTASVAGNITNVATYLTGDGTLSTTNAQGLTLGSSSTGNVVINSRGSAALTANGANLTTGNNISVTGIAYFANGTTYYIDASGNSNLNAGTFASTVTLPNTNTLTGLANFVQLNNGLEVGGGSTYYFDKTGNINANNVTGAVLNATTSVNTGAGAGTARIDSSGNLTNIGTTQLHGVTYTWPAADGSSGYALTTNGAGILSWAPASGLGTNYWSLTNGALYPQNNTVDLLIGASATTSAKFAFTNVNTGLPTASIAGDIANVATYLTGDGNLATTNMRDLTLGGSTTGQVVINSRGSAALTANGANITANGIAYFANGTTYYIDASGNSNLNAGTFAGNVAVNGANLTTTSTGTAALFNTNATTLNIGGAATTLSIGAATGITNINNNASVSGNLTLAGAARSIQTTTFNPLTIGGTTTGNITLSPSNNIVGGNVSPNVTNVTDLGLSSKEFRNIYGQALFQNGNAVCDSTGTNCPSGAGLWAQNLGAIYPVNNSVDLLLGSNATTSAKFAFTGVDGGLPTASVAGNVTNVATYLTGNGNLATTNLRNLTLGGTTTGNIILSPSNDAAGGFIGPNTNANTDLGTSTNTFRNVYGTTLYTGGTARLDSSGNLTNIGTTQLHGITYTWPAADAAVSGYVLSSNGAGTLSWIAQTGGGGQWTMDATNGVIYPNSQTVDVLMGGTATTSAKFAFKGIDGGLPTASISGNVANVATYVNGNGNLATTNMQDLTLGSSTTGQVILNSRGSNALIANGLNLTAGGTITLPNSNTLTGVGSYLQNSQGYSVGGGTTYHFDSSGNIVANNVAVNGGSLTTTAGTLNAFTANATVINLGINGSGSVNIGGGSASNGCTFSDTNGTLTCSGNMVSLASSGTNGWWQLNNKVLSPSNSTYDLTIGGSATGSAFQAFGIENTTGDIAKLNSTVITSGNVFEATASAITSGNIIKLGQGGNTNFTGNAIFADMDNTGQGGIGFTGNFLKFNNAGTTQFTLSSAGNLDAAGTASISGSLTFKAGTGTIQTTTFSPLVIGGTTTGNISLNPSNSLGFVGINKSSPLFNLDVNGSASISGTLSLAPMVQGTAGTCNASSAGKEYYDGIANQYYFCNGTSWTAIGSGTNYWQLNNKILSPANSTYDLAIGGTATGSAFQVFGSETPTSGLEALNSTVTTTGNILSATSSAVTSGNIFNLGQGGTANFTGSGLAMNFGVGGGGSFTGNFLNLKNNGTAKFTVDATGNVSGAGALQIGAGTNTVAYSRIGTSTDNGHFGTPVLGDLLVSGRSEFVGNMYLDNGTTGSFTISDYQGTGAIIFPALPTSDFHTLSAGSWKVDNTQNIGKAAFVVNQSSTVNDIFDASSGGTLRFSIANNGDTVVGNTGLGKITVGTVDPPYTINGQKYATYLPGITGVKEETTGTLAINEYVSGKGYRSVIDFNNPNVGSDLWVFSKATDIKDNLNSLVALLTPSDDTRTWYEVDKTNNKVAVYSSRPTEVSYRLTAPRFDSADHPNTRTDGAQGFVLNIPDVVNNNAIATTIQNMSDYVITSIGNGVYSLKDSSGTVIDGIESIGNFVAANIRAGSATVQQLTSSSVNTKLISPLANESDINIQVGTATQSGKLAIQNAAGTQVASIDDQGNATFSGTVKSQNIDAIQNLLTQVSTDQNVLSQIVNSQISTTSANLSNLITSDLYVTNQAAVNSLSVTKNVAIGPDFVIGSQNKMVNGTLQMENTLDTLSAPLKIQSLAMAPIELMAGLVKIDTKGNVNIAGDLAVAGRVKASGLTLTDNQQLATTSASLLTLQNSTGSDVATVDASGSAVFNSLATGGLTIAGASVASSSALINGTITTNSTVGSAAIPAGVTEITIKNPKVTDYTLVYVTPTSSTQNNVLYIKSKQAGQFTLGFDRPVPQDVTFNWWIVQVQN